MPRGTKLRSDRLYTSYIPRVEDVSLGFIDATEVSDVGFCMSFIG